MSGGPADVQLDTFKTLVWDVFVEKAAELALSKITWGALGWFSFLSGPLSTILSWAAIWFTDILYTFFKDGINLSIIMLNNEIQHAEYVKASDALTKAFDQYGMDSPQFKETRDAHKAALAKFVRNTSD